MLTRWYARNNNNGSDASVCKQQKQQARQLEEARKEREREERRRKLEELEQKVESDPKDHQARMDYALALNAEGKREQAAEQLVTIVRVDRTWNDDGARTQLLEFFEAWGNADPATVSGRRALSSVLFS